MRIQILIFGLKGSKSFRMKLDSLQIAFSGFLNECISFCDAHDMKKLNSYVTNVARSSVTSLFTPF